MTYGEYEQAGREQTHGIEGVTNQKALDDFASRVRQHGFQRQQTSHRRIPENFIK